MNVRGPRSSRRWWWFAVVLAAFALAGMESRPERLGPANPAADAVRTVGQPVQAALSRTGGAVAGAWQFVTQLFDRGRENARLRQQVAQGQAQTEQVAEYQAEVARLRALLGLREAVTRQAVSARVVAKGPSPWFQTLTVNAGRRDRVVPGAAVLGPGGLIGQVFQVSYASCQVLCLTDRLGSVGARVQPERARQVVGVAKGDGGDLLTLVYHNAGPAVQMGDAVVTSGREQGSRFPPGLLVGHVVGIVRRPDESSLTLTLRPAAEPDRAEEVLILLPAPEDAS